MGSSFNPQILVGKLAKLNGSQASIENWCIFHMNKAKHVVETRDRQFHYAPCEQRLAYLYLANDILQNSRRKGSEFVGEFWKVLPDALRNVIEDGDEFGRNAALRLINIWEQRKVFGSHGQILKEEFLQWQTENRNRNGKHVHTPVKMHSFQQKQPIGNTVDKILSGYNVLYGGQTDEDVILSTCSNAVSYFEKAEKEVEGGLNIGHSPGREVLEEVQGQHATLRDCIEQLRTVETSRKNLISHLREALKEQELKLEQLRNQLQAATSQSERVAKLCGQLLNHNNLHLAAEQNPKEIPTSTPPQSLEQTAVMYTQQASSFPENPNQTEEDHRKSAAAAMAAKLTASTSSAQMLSYVLSSLASEGVIGKQQVNDSPLGENPPEKRPKLENSQQPGISFFETQQQNVASTRQEAVPLLPSSAPPEQPPTFQLPQFLQPLQPPEPVNHVPFNHNMSMSMPGAERQASSVPGYSPSSAQTTPENSSRQNLQGSEVFYSVISLSSSSMHMAPIGRQ